MVSFASSSSSSIEVIFEENTPNVSSSLSIVGSNPIIGKVDFPAPIFFDGDKDEKGLTT